MRNHRIIVVFMTLLLLLTAAAAMYGQERLDDTLFSVVVTMDGRSETIQFWEQDETCYVFLPSSATPPARCELFINPRFPVWIAEERVHSGTVCAQFPFSEELPLYYRKWGIDYGKSVCFYQSTNVPALFIDTASGSMDYIHKEKGNAESGKLRLYRQDGALDCEAQIRSINGRGNSTWTLPKKPYSLELAQKEDLLDMGAAKKWILLTNGVDKTHMGNKMCYDLAAKAGCAYSPECRWVDLYLNGNYAGLYLLCERNEVDPQRVDIPKEGSFLISKEHPSYRQGRSYTAFSTQRDYFYRIHDAGMEVHRIQEIWQSVEDAIFAEDGIDPRTGKSWDELIDVDSWAQQFLICDSFMDCDAGNISKYFYYDPEKEKVFAGPIWDMDDLFVYTDSLGYLASGRRFISNAEKESMFYRLSQKDRFQKRLNQLYREEFRPLLLELAETGMDQYYEQIQTAIFLNDIRWEKKDAQSVIASRKRILLDRISFFDEYLGSQADYRVISLASSDRGWWRSIAVKRGETADFLISDGRTWLDYKTGEPFDITAPVMDDWVIYQTE